MRPRMQITSIHQCCGSPLKPEMPTRRVCNVVWSGVRLAALLADCEPDPAAQFVWSSGADYGVFEGDDCDAFVKDLPLDRVAADVLIAFEMNGSPLRPENGYPMRLGPISPIASMTARIHAGSGLKDFPRAFNTSGHIPIPPVAASGDPSYSPDCGLPRCLC